MTNNVESIRSGGEVFERAKLGSPYLISSNFSLPVQSSVVSFAFSVGGQLLKSHSGRENDYDSRIGWQIYSTVIGENPH